MDQAIRRIVIVGGGTAGWMAAALLKQVLGEVITVTLVESSDIGSVGVGEATIPPIRHINTVLGMDEAQFMRATGATIKLGIQFEHWRVPGEHYLHSFGEPGKASAFCRFHDYWLRARTELGDLRSLWDYDLNYLAAKAGKFARMQVKDPALDIPYAYHFDAARYAQCLRRHAEASGVQRIDGKVTAVDLDGEHGHVRRLHLHDGAHLDGDLFLDCSGFRGLLIQGKLNSGYDDWSHWLPCDRALALPSARFATTLPYTRAIAHRAGWQWRIPLQHRNGNGLVFSSAHMSETEAQTQLLANLDSEPMGEPRMLTFRTGRCRKPWHKNVIAIGLASGFLEPLESTSIHLIQSAIVRLLKLFPHRGLHRAECDEYNRQTQVEYQQIRDFLILHYHLNARSDSDFWQDLRRMDIPDTLAHKIELFRRSGKLVREQDDLFFESSWLQVLIGQGLMPDTYHPLADKPSSQQLQQMLSELRSLKQSPLNSLPSHDQFLRMFCGQ